MNKSGLYFWYRNQRKISLKQQRLKSISTNMKYEDKHVDRSRPGASVA